MANEALKKDLRQKVKKIVGNCREDDQMSKQDMKFLLPVSEQKSFPELF